MRFLALVGTCFAVAQGLPAGAATGRDGRLTVDPMTTVGGRVSVRPAFRVP